MLFVPIRYINNGEPLDQITLNRSGFDVQSNLEEIIARLTGVEGGTGGSVAEIPNTIALRDANGTTQFAPPIKSTNPLRLGDIIDDLVSPNSGAALSANMGYELAQMISDRAGSQVSVRQTLISGPSGYVNGFYGANFLTSAGLSVSVRASGVPVIGTIGKGFNNMGGQIDDVFSIPEQLAWNLPSGLSRVFLFVAYDPTSQNVTTGYTTKPPVAVMGDMPDGEVPVGTYVYPRNHQNGGRYNNGTDVLDVNWLFVGQCVTTGGVVSDLRSYSYGGVSQGKYSNWRVNTRYKVPHNIGWSLSELDVSMTFTDLTGASTPYHPAPSSELVMPIENNTIYERGTGFYGTAWHEPSPSDIEFQAGNMRILEYMNSTGYLTGTMHYWIKRKF